MQAAIKKPAEDNKYLSLYEADDVVRAVHFMVSNQRAVRKALQQKWGTLVPLLEVQIGKLLNEKLAEDDILFRREPFSYYIVSANRDQSETACFSERLAAYVYEKVFSADTHLQELQISLSSITLQTKTISDDKAFREALFGVHDSDGWNSIVSHHNFASRKPEQVNHSLIRQIIALRGMCDHFFSSIPHVPDTDEALKEHLKQLQKLQQASGIVTRNINNLLKDLPLEEEKDAPPEVKAPPKEIEEPVKAEPVATEEDEIQLDVQKQIAADAEVAYYPIWNVARQMIDMYRCTIVRHLPSGVVEINTGAETQHGSYVVDYLIVRKVIADLELFTEPDSDCSVYLPIHANTIQSKKHFQPIANKLKSLSLTDRKQLLICITGVTENTTAEMLQKLVSTVRPYCKSVSYRYTGLNKLPSAMKKAGGNAIGLHVDDLTITTADLTREIEVLAENAETFKLVSFVDGVNSVATAATAIGAGISLISGDAVGTPLEIPWGVVDFKVESLYSKVLSS